MLNIAPADPALRLLTVGDDLHVVLTRRQADAIARALAHDYFNPSGDGLIVRQLVALLMRRQTD